jgi:hypothetical protein
MSNHHTLKAVLDLDLDPIKVKLMHKQSGEGWDLAKVNAVEVEYKRFLHLSQAFPNEQIAPTNDVDTFWHYHILDTMKYAADCQQAFGYFLHHFPYLGMRGEEDEAELQRSGERMAQLYQATFGTPYPGSAAYCTRAIEADNAYCTRAQPAAADAAYCTRAQPANLDAAYCTRAQPATMDAAYCTRAQPAAIDAAYCTRAQPTTVDAAYCTRGQPATANAAYCTRSPAQGAAAAVTESFDMTRPTLAAA